MIERDGERERQRETEREGETGERVFDTKKNVSFAQVYKIMIVLKQMVLNFPHNRILDFYDIFTIT